MSRNIILISSFILLTSLCGYGFTSSWYISTIDTIGSVGLWTSLALDSVNFPHISYQGNGDLKYAYYDGTKWTIEAIDTDGFAGDYSSIALDNSGLPHISYYDDSNGYLKYAYKQGASWFIKVVDSEKNSGIYTSIALDSENHPHISYLYSPSQYSGSLKYAYYDGTKWNISVIDSGSGIVGMYTSIALDSNDNPHISYFDSSNKDLKYAYYDGTKWNISIVDSTGDVGWFTSIAIDSNDHPHISYYDMTNGDLRYALFNGSSWNKIIVDSSGDQGWFTSLALDSSDYPHISYYDNFGYNLKYAYYDGGSWHIEPIDIKGDVGYFTSIKLGSSDNPHISYYDATNSDLRYAWYGVQDYINLISFIAKPNGSSVVLKWTISTDEQISGFNLYRRIATPSTKTIQGRTAVPGCLTGDNAQSPTYSNTTVRENSHSPLQMDDNTQWTRVNTTLITGTNPYSYTDNSVKPETIYEYKLEAVVLDRQETLGTTECTSGNGTPNSFDIVSIYPSPASSIINFDVNIPTSSDIDIAIYDITGRRVATIESGQYNEGEYTLSSDITGLTDGVYVVKMMAGGLSASKRFVVSK